MRRLVLLGLLLGACLEPGEPVYGGYPEICGDAEDNDGDGRIDCADPDCADYCRNPLQIAFTSPEEGATSASPSDPVAVVFDGEVTSARVSLKAGEAAVAELEQKRRGPLLEVRPKGGFAADTAYELTIEEARTSGRTGLAQPAVIRFTTGAADAPPRLGQIQAIWAAACTRCHDGRVEAAGLDLRRSAGTGPVGKRSFLCGSSVFCDDEDFTCAGDCSEDGPWSVIDPGKPCHSCMLKLVRTHAMPLEGAKLSDEHVDRIERWILAGAPQ